MRSVWIFFGLALGGTWLLQLPALLGASGVLPGASLPTSCRRRSVGSDHSSPRSWLLDSRDRVAYESCSRRYGRVSTLLAGT